MIRKSKLVTAMVGAFRGFMYGLPPLSALQLEKEDSYQGEPSLNECSHRLMANQVRDIRASSPKTASRFDDIDKSASATNALKVKALNAKALLPPLSLQDDPTKVITNQLTQQLIEKQERVINDTFALACSDHGLNVGDVDLYQIDGNNGSRVYAIKIDGERIDLVALGDLFNETQGRDNEYYYAKVFCNYKVLYESKYYD